MVILARQAATWAALLALSGCSSQVGRQGGKGGGQGSAEPVQPGGMDIPSTPTAVNPGPGVEPSAVTAARLPLQRLTQLEYTRTVRDLLGDPSLVPALLPGDTISASGYLEGITIGPSEATGLQEAAERLASAAVPTLGQWAPCDAASMGEDACAAQFIEQFGFRAFRRPLEAVEVSEFTTLYATAKTTLGYDYPERIRVLLTAFLQSAPFLYHHEVAAPSAVLASGLVRLGPYQLASRLSYLLLRSMPDQALFEAAARGELEQASGVRAQAERLLATPFARALLEDFSEQWLLLEGVATVTKDASFASVFGDAERVAARRETGELGAVTLLDPLGRAGLKDFFTATQGVVDASLATLYGVGSPPPAGVWQQVALPAERAGVLTRAAFLATQAGPSEGSAIRRGKVIRTRLLCQALPPPPNNVPELEPLQPGDTSRRRLERHSTDVACSGCHSLIDPLGFAFESFDAVGRLRATDQGLPVDTSGRITNVAGGPRPFANTQEFASALAELPEFQDCAARQLYRFMAGRLETASDGADVNAAYQALVSEPRLAFDRLILALVEADSFTHRQPYPGDLTP
jgi:hypothetical protein